MALRTIGRNVKMDLLRQEGDICQIMFKYKETQKASRLFLNVLKEKGSISRADLSDFAWQLQKGEVEPGFLYTRTQFYRVIRPTLLTLGFIGIIQQVHVTTKTELQLEADKKRKRNTDTVYVPIKQPIVKRPPDGLNFVRLSWIICKKWNDEFFPDVVEEKVL
jgi:hypothetical protein